LSSKCPDSVSNFSILFSLSTQFVHSISQTDFPCIAYKVDLE
jgi:hypothetical protein